MRMIQCISSTVHIVDYFTLITLTLFNLFKTTLLFKYWPKIRNISMQPLLLNANKNVLSSDKLTKRNIFHNVGSAYRGEELLLEWELDWGGILRNTDTSKQSESASYNKQVSSGKIKDTGRTTQSRRNKAQNW